MPWPKPSGICSACHEVSPITSVTFCPLVSRPLVFPGFPKGRVVRRAQPVKIRGLNRNHQPRLKEIFKSAALSAIRQPGPFKEYYDVRVSQGRDPALLRLSVARKLAALVLSLWKKGGRYRAQDVKQA